MIVDNNKQECDGENYILLIWWGHKLSSLQLVGPNAQHAKFPTLTMPPLLLNSSVLLVYPVPSYQMDYVLGAVLRVPLFHL